MNIKDGYISKKVTFDTHDSLGEKIDRLTSMMNKLTAQDDNQNKQFKPKIYQSKQRGQTRSFYDQNYDQRNYQNRYRSNSADKRISLSVRIQYGQNYRIIEVKIIEVYIEEIIEMIITEVEVGLGIDSIQTIPEGVIEVVVGLDKVQELVLIDRIR